MFEKSDDGRWESAGRSPAPGSEINPTLEQHYLVLLCLHFINKHFPAWLSTIPRLVKLFINNIFKNFFFVYKCRSAWGGGVKTATADLRTILGN